MKHRLTTLNGAARKVLLADDDTDIRHIIRTYLEDRGYAVVGLLSRGFTAAGIRGGRQKGAKSKAEDFAVTGRLDFVGVPGLLLGGSFYTGNSGQGATVDDRTIRGRVDLFDLHGRRELK